MKSKFFKNMGRQISCGLLATKHVALLFLFAGSLQAAEQKVLSGHVPAAVATFHLQSLGMLTNSARLNLAIGLPLRNGPALENFLTDVYNPASPNYRHYLTPEQFAQNFGPSEQDYQAVIDFARTNGLTINGIYSNRTVLSISGNVSDIQKAFNTTLQEYQHPLENRKFFAPSSEPTVSASLPILHVQGLDNYVLPHAMSHKIPLAGAQTASGSGPGGALIGIDFRNAYLPGVSLDGTGQIVGLLQFDGYSPNDIVMYEGLAGLPNVPLENILLDGFDGSAGANNDEVCLDIETSISMAPGLTKVVLFEGELPNTMLSSMVSHPEIKQFSASWGYGTDSTTRQLYKQLAAQGQTFLNASGDGDAWVGPIPFGSCEDTNITIVGGTTLTMTGAGKTYASEKAWNWGNVGGFSWNPDGFVGTSGGISTDVGIPIWQQGIDMTLCHGSTTKRNVPDVALTGDNVFVVSSGGQTGAFGGTSCASPLFAGFMALVNQQAANSDKPPVGFLAPAVYAIANSSSYNTCFHDTKAGDNTWDQSPTSFFAVAGYDLCTGLGTPNGLAFITALSGGLPPRNGFLQLNVDPASQSVLINSSTQTVFIAVNDVYGVTNATVTGFLTDGTPVVFSNDGATPDVTAGDSIYSGSFAVPASGNSLTLTVIASATNEIGVTNVLNYFLTTLPSNDNFTNATKVSAAGSVYLSNNRSATRESGEPQKNVAASLWWSWTPAVSTNVLINTIGSKVENILAVYTGNVLANLQTVVVTNSTLSQFTPAQVNFSVTAGVTYKIAVSSASASSLGTVALHVVLAGKPDTNAPTVSVSSPASGLTVTNQILTITGSASDSGANASGINQVFVSVNGSKTVAVGTTSWSATVGLQAGVNTINVSAVDNAGNIYTLPSTIQVVYLVQTPANDFFVHATPLAGTSGTVSASNSDATKEVGEPNHAENAGGASLWWSFTPPSDGVLTLNTTNSTFDTLLGLYTGNSVSQLTTIASDDDAFDSVPGGFSLIEQAVKSGTTYYIAVDGYNNVLGTISLSYSFVPATLHLVAITNAAGGTVQLSTTNSLGGISVTPSTSAYFADGSTVTLTATANFNSQFDIWGGNVVSLENPLTIIANTNINLAAIFDAVLPTDGFESGNLSHLNWKTTGNAAWFVQTNIVDQGLFSARSGNIGDSQSSSLILTTNFFAGTGSFDYRVSSEATWDTLNFYVDGVLLQKWSGSGQANWENYSFSLAAGIHTLQWTYIKDPSGASGLDAAFIDNVNLPLSPAKNSSTSAQLQLKRQTDGQFYVNLQGQPNQLYIVQTSTNLIDWSNVSTNIANGAIINIPLPANGTSQSQFYRAVVP